MEPAYPADPVARLREELHALDRAYSAGHHGLWSAKRRAEMFDAALLAMFDAADPPPGIGLAALGGYGRRQQLPSSDVDLLIVHDGRSPRVVAVLTERLLYPLWEGGFEIGQAVRTPAECERIAHQRLDTLTSMLDLRSIAGDEDLAREAADRVRGVATADVPGFARALADAAEARAERSGVTAHLLEPDLKNGLGGLRDVHVVRWVTAVAGHALVRSAERDALEAAEEFLTRVRSTLQFETGRRADRLLLELQPPVARAMGFADEPLLIAEDGLMRAVFEHARAVRWVSENVLDRARERTSMPSDPPVPFGGADDVLDALASLAEAGLRPDARLLDSIEATPMTEPIEWTTGTRDAFLRILRSGDAGVAALDALDRLGLLTRLLPAWRDVRCRPQRDPYHRFTVDTHLTAALAETGRLLATGGPRDPTTEWALAQAPDRDGLLLGALLHDIGKTGEGGHVPVGARIATDLLDHMGVRGPARELAAFLVAEHLLLPDTATRRDLTDENLILDVAARIGSPERLAALALLAEADATATGPAAWTPWRQALLRELTTRVRRVYERGDMGPELAHRLTTTVDVVRGLLDAEPENAIERFVLRMPRGYFLSVEPERIAAHYPTIAPDVGATEVRSAAWPAGVGAYELLVVAADRPGLLSWIAGAVALAGLSIRTAQAFTTDDGVAVDLFEVEGVFEEEIGEPRWREFRNMLRKAVEGRASLEHRLAEKRARYPAPLSSAPVTVAVDNEASDYSTVIEVGAPDRIGVLYEITSALADLTLDVRLAKVATYTGRVVDAFYVRDAIGRKVTEPAPIAEIEAAIRARLGGGADDPPDDGSRTDGASYEILEHTADLGIRAWGPTLRAAFEQAVWGIADVMGARADHADELHEVVLSAGDPAGDPAGLLVELLNELISLCDSEEVSIASIHLPTLTRSDLRAEIGLAVDTRPEGLAVKAATYHEVSVLEEPEGRAEVVVYLDV